MNSFVIPQRFCGPPHSGNGGWTAGALAERHLQHASLADEPGTHPWVQVTLRTPPPLDTHLAVHHDDGRTVIVHEDAVVAEAVTAPDQAALDDRTTWTPGVTAEQARAARDAYPDAALHPFGGCFVCGPDRAEGDGLRLFTGRVPGDDRVASPWTPPAEADSDTGQPAFSSTAITWAALDCPSAWADDLLARPMVLGRMSARILTPPRVGTPHVVVGRALRRDGRRTYTASALHTLDGTVVAVASHIWFAIDPAMFR